ncbi:MAG: flagellin, partial [Paracoccaceae bacterium]|nr:flagellin [Paracoccaceae bacterium]
GLRSLMTDVKTNFSTLVDAVDNALKGLGEDRASLGALRNRLSHTVNNLTNISINLTAAKGGIEDADFAIETTKLAKNQILQRAATAMLAQANASKQNVLTLLRN